MKAMVNRYTRIAVLTLMLGLGARAGAQENPTEQVPDDLSDDQMLVRVDDNELLVWQAKLMLENGAGRDLASAAKLWIDIQVNAQAARQRDLHEDRDTRFMMNLIRENYLAGQLVKSLDKDIPEVPQAQAREFYQENLARYKVPFTATVHHISLNERDLAEKVAQRAQEPEADFQKLYEKYSETQEKNKGKLAQASYEWLRKNLGQEAAEAIKDARDGEVLGPFLGLKGFEVIKVETINPARTKDFEEVEDEITQQLRFQKKRTYIQEKIDSLREQADIEKSEALRALEKEKEQAPQPPRQGKSPMDEAGVE